MTEENFAAEWKSHRGQVVELPSGNKARVVRTMSMLVGLKEGTIPNPLRRIVQRMVDSGGEKGMTKKEEDNPEVLKQMTELMNKTICEAVTNPKIVMPPEDVNWDTWFPQEEGVVSIVDLSDQDKAFIYSVAQGGTTDLEQFRNEQAKFMASVADGKEVSVPSKRPARANGTGRRSQSVVRG